MSSKQGNKDRREASIRRKLQLHVAGQKFSAFFGADFLMLLLMALGAGLHYELMAIGRFDMDLSRSFAVNEGTLYYVVKEGRKVLLSQEVWPVLRVILVITGVILLIQSFGILISLAHEKRRIGRILAPLKEMAEQVERLSKMEPTDDQYHAIEDAIAHVRPEDMAPLSLGDEDLKGIEAAMNSLLLRLKESQLQQARFVNDASHELRTPIAVIDGYANMLSRWGTQDEKVLEESITAISHESKHMQHLVDQLLFLARGDNGKNKLEPERISVGELLQEIFEESLMIDEDHIYRYNMPETPIYVQADPGMLKQAVRVLVDNSAKYTETKDEIVLSAGCTAEGTCFLQVQDTGIGMTQADVSHIFERFYRADAARNFEGTGLGLSIAKWIVDKHGGHFEVLSRTGLGTRIRIVLPAAND